VNNQLLVIYFGVITVNGILFLLVKKLQTKNRG